MFKLILIKKKCKCNDNLLGYKYKNHRLEDFWISDFQHFHVLILHFVCKFQKLFPMQGLSQPKSFFRIYKNFNNKIESRLRFEK